jgi:predicted RNA-binding Zn-ribbon protein involved in translation (DUF1610 family)
VEPPASIQIIKIEDELHTCPKCGYKDGFHTSFIRVNSDKDNIMKSSRALYRVILICPECGARYDVGWTCTLTR